jgi:serine phosphatase RsbU (regulator of sigma subunit)
VAEVDPVLSLLRDEPRHYYTAGEAIFLEGEIGALMYFVLEGAVTITVQGRHLDFLAAGSIFGEMALVENNPRSATATAATDCVLLALDRARISDLVRQSPEFAIHIMATTSSRLRRLVVEEVRRQRLEEELKIGRDIQLSLLPTCCPELPGWEINAYYEPAREVGGDFYDFVVRPDDPDHLLLVIADVTGKGVPAALFMASARTTLRAEALTGCGPGDVLRRTNRVLRMDRRLPLFLSAFYAMLDHRSGCLHFANAGHERPLWRRVDGTVQPLDQHDFVLGLFHDVVYGEWSIEMQPGDCLVMFTDGVTEARNATGEFFGESRLEQVVAASGGGSASELLRAIVEALGAFAGSTPPADDCTMVVLKRAAH